MIQNETILQVADNSGAQELLVICVLKKALVRLASAIK